jgi:dihydroflavonol-4-reductase
MNVENYRVLVTGGTGVVGRYVIEALVKQGCAVRVLSRNPQKYSWLKNLNIESVPGDITDPVAVENAMAGVTHVVHAAALVSLWPRRLPEMLETNLEGTRHVLAACKKHGIQRMIHIGALASLGEPDDPAITKVTESTATHPRADESAYTASKRLANDEVDQAAREGLPVVTVHPPLILGVGDWESSSAAFFKLMHGGFAFYTDMRLPAVSADDLTHVIISLLFTNEYSGEKFFVTAGALGGKEMFELIAKSIGKPAPTIKLPTALIQSIGWLSEKISFISNREPLFTIASANVLTENYPYEYVGEKAARLLNFQYKPLPQVITETGKALLEARETT